MSAAKHQLIGERIVAGSNTLQLRANNGSVLAVGGVPAVPICLGCIADDVGLLLARLEVGAGHQFRQHANGL